MAEYIKLKDIMNQFSFQKGDGIFLTSDVKQLLYSCIEHDDDTDLNVLLDSLIEIIGEEGTIVIPTFNWDFCKGIDFDYAKTPCKTGSIGKIALKRSDFKRTKHPIYSFAVWGKGQEELCAMDNKSSFGADSPFTYVTKHHFKNLLIDKDCQHSFVYVHYVEEQVGITYRYIKDFTANYTDENRVTQKRTYSMNVRDLSKDVFITIYPLEEDFIKAGVSKRYVINEIGYKVIDLAGAYPIIADDVKNNRSRKISTYIGQED
ncbi:MAG: AAC(3) family N-acetyltransferase [Clostridia bacterium]|nr:AAC(3) family N-acetyltransferase [Clostridia bacterium]